MKKIYTIAVFIIVILITFFSYNFFTHQKTEETEAALSRNGLILDFNFGNNDGAATPTVYDSSGFDRHATAANTQTCDDSKCTFGLSDYMTSTITGLFNTPEITISIKFVPTWDADDGVLHYIMDTSNLKRYIIAKIASNEIMLYLGNTEIVRIPLATYQDYWKTNEENIIIISGSATTNRTDAYLNGHKILDQDTTAWTEANPDTLYIGITKDLSSWWIYADIYYLKVWNRLLTSNEIANLSADRKQTTQIASKTGLTFDMNFGNNDGAATPTVYDTSGFDRHTTAQNAQTCTNTYCDFNGTDDNITGVATNVFNSNNISIAINFSPDFQADSALGIYILGTTSGSRYLVVHNGSNTLGIWLAETNIINIPLATYQPFWKVGEENVLIIRGTSGDTDVFLNGNAIATNVATAWTAKNPADIYIGHFAGSYEFDGKMYYLKVWNRLLTDNEVQELSKNRIGKAQAPSRTGLVGYWTLDEEDINGTTVYDKSGQNNHGTSANTPTMVAGKIGQAMSFDNSTDYIEMANNQSLDFTSTYTVSAWVKLNAKENYDHIFNRGSGDVDDIEIYSNSIGFAIAHNRGNGGTFDYSQFANADLVPGKWTLVTITYSATTVTLYFDGEYVNSDANLVAPIDTDKLSRIGWSENSVFGALDHFGGDIDDVRIYNRALSASEVMGLYKSSRKIYIK